MNDGPLWYLINQFRGERGITIENNIYLFGVADPTHSTLTHELTHVWQYQHGGPVYKMVAFDYQIYGGGGYDWQAEFDNSPSAGWLTLNPEAQAQLIEDMFKTPPSFWPNRTSFVFDGTNYTPRAIAASDYVRRGIGAPSVFSDGKIVQAMLTETSIASLVALGLPIVL
jgi:hypothetical protein